VGTVLEKWTESRPEVLRLAAEDPDGRVRAHALNLLIVKKEIGLVDFFAERLRKDDSPYARRNCCRALGEFGATVIVAGNIPGLTQTIPAAIYQRVQIGEDAAAGRLVLVSILLALVTIGWATALVHRKR